MIGIFEKSERIKKAFGKIKTELDDHLYAINQNTNEINNSQDYIMKLESLVCKLNERIDEMELKLANFSGEKINKINPILLTVKEHEIFSLIYSRNGNLISFLDIARNLGYTEELVRKHVEHIIAKGIPIIKKYFDNSIFLVLDNDFSNLHAKNNIVLDSHSNMGKLKNMF